MCSGQYRDTYHDTTNVLYGLSLTLPIPNQMIACSQENNRKNVCVRVYVTRPFSQGSKFMTRILEIQHKIGYLSVDQ